MKLITVTSDNYRACTRLMLESLRVWHPASAMAVTVYALDRGWKDEYTAELAAAPFHATVELIHEGDPVNRGGALGTAVFAVWKTHVLASQTEPFIFLDSDILVLKPLTELVERTRRDGWVTVHEPTPVSRYNEGEQAALSGLSGDMLNQPGFNTGVIGCDPDQNRDVLDLAVEYGDRITRNNHGDQGLINIAYLKLRGHVPPSAGSHLNGGWYTDDRIDLRQTILHFARPNYPCHPRTKLDDQREVWTAWPRGVALVNLVHTDFWQRSLPHPWEFLNQANQRRHRARVKELRAASRSLLGTQWLLIRTADEAYLLDRSVLREQAAFWSEHAARFKDVKHVPTYHLPGDGTGRATTNRWRELLRV